MTESTKIDVVSRLQETREAIVGLRGIMDRIPPEAVEMEQIMARCVDAESKLAAFTKDECPVFDVAQEPITRYFDYAHLPPHLQAISRPFRQLAGEILRLPMSAERTVALRKLLESKDCAVRAALPIT